MCGFVETFRRRDVACNVSTTKQKTNFRNFANQRNLNLYFGHFVVTQKINLC